MTNGRFVCGLETCLYTFYPKHAERHFERHHSNCKPVLLRVEEKHLYEKHENEEQIQRDISSSEEDQEEDESVKYYHCSHEECVKRYKYKYDHTYNTHANDAHPPVYEECRGSPVCAKCEVYCK